MKPDLRAAGLALLLPLALAACNQDKQPATAGTAGGEVLPGSVSDAMLPVDQVKSQPPLAPKSEGGGGKADWRAGGNAVSAGAAAALPSGEPAAEASPAEPKPEARPKPEPRPQANPDEAKPAAE